jgi:hypothetical protein
VNSKEKRRKDKNAIGYNHVLQRKRVETAATTSGEKQLLDLVFYHN